MEEQGYIIRYEKGNFQSGYCMVKDRKIVVINKFLETEARCNCLSEVMSEVQIDAAIFSEKSAKFYEQLNNNSSQEAQDKAITS